MALAPSVTSDEVAFRIRPAPFYGMRFRLRHLLFFPPLFLLAGCETPTEPSAPTLEFAGQVIFGFPTIPTVVSAETGGILVSGELRTPTLGYSIRGVLSSEGSRALRLEVEAYLIEEPLPFVSQHYYRAHLKNLARGSYDLTVVRTFLYAQVVSDTVFRGSIRVQ
jgi:hypothetical protein